jgi:hypothetical protein
VSPSPNLVHSPLRKLILSPVSTSSHRQKPTESSGNRGCYFTFAPKRGKKVLLFLAKKIDFFLETFWSKKAASTQKYIFGIFCKTFLSFFCLPGASHRDQYTHRESRHALPEHCMDPGNTKGGSITVPLTSCFTGLESAVWLLTIFVFICKQTNPNQSNRRSTVQWYFPL